MIEIRRKSEKRSHQREGVRGEKCIAGNSSRFATHMNCHLQSLALFQPTSSQRESSDFVRTFILIPDEQKFIKFNANSCWWYCMILHIMPGCPYSTFSNPKLYFLAKEFQLPRLPSHFESSLTSILNRTKEQEMCELACCYKKLLKTNTFSWAAFPASS